MKCSCGSLITAQANKVSERFNIPKNTLCLYCLSKELGRPYQELLERVMGFDDCRDCFKRDRMEERKKLLGLR